MKFPHCEVQILFKTETLFIDGTQNLIFSLHNSPEGPFTLLAPTDEAFSRIPRETLKKVLENADILKPIIQRHIIPKKALHVKGISWDVHNTLGGQMVS